MADVLVVFGSASDAKVYDQLLEKLRQQNTSFAVRVCSAHRTPQKIAGILQEHAPRIIVAGAGLSAALPGVIAAHSIKPVIGIPCTGAFGGLDAFLSIVQMPPNIPVVGTAIEDVDAAADAVAKFLKNPAKICIMENSSGAAKKAVEKCAKALDSLGVEYSKAREPEPDSIAINFVALGEKPKQYGNALVLNVPVAGGSSKEDALKFCESANGFLWLGANRGENAALAAIQLANSGARFDEKINCFRQELKQKVLEADSAERKKGE